MIDWSKAPEGATHCLIKDSGTAWFRFKDDLSFPNTWKDGEWKNVRLPTRELTPKPKQPKTLTQAVFDGLPSEYRWAYLDRDGDPFVIGDLEAELDARFPDRRLDCYEDGLELATWMDSVLWRKESITDVARSIEAARVSEKSGNRCATCTANICSVIDDCVINSLAKLDSSQDLKLSIQILDDQPEAQVIDPPILNSGDMVNNPSHYTTGGIECIDAMQAMLSRDEFIGYLRGNVFKYQWRYQHKNGIEDLKKAQWYANRLIELESAK